MNDFCMGVTTKESSHPKLPASNRCFMQISTTAHNTTYKFHTATISFDNTTTVGPTTLLPWANQSDKTTLLE